MTASAAESGFYGNIQALASLRRDAAGGEAGAVREAAQQFEALFLQMMLEQMREATIEGGLFDSNQMQTYYGMFDRQVALDVAQGGGLGLSDLLVRQLGAPATGSSRDAAPIALDPPLGGSDESARGATADRTDGDLDRVRRGAAFAGRDEFVETLAPLVERVARRLDVPARGVLAQSALETGWGQQVMHDEQGAPAWNLFGIKAGSDWSGRTVTAVTVEVRDGVAVRETARFRAYDSPADAVEDYARLLADSPRYAGVGGTGDDVAGFARALQAAGYATDPEYADKIERISRDLHRDAPAQVSDGLAAHGVRTEFEASRG
jgi:flagellar protein FlgJ